MLSPGSFRQGLYLTLIQMGAFPHTRGKRQPFCRENIDILQYSLRNSLILAFLSVVGCKYLRGEEYLLIVLVRVTLIPLSESFDVVVLAAQSV